jgi:hypothetical protein
MANRKIWLWAAIATSMWCGSVIDSIAGECRLESPAHRATVIELYTSEGCNSCPPVDRWFGGLALQGISPETAVLLAFHVDYWNQLGWPDRFSRSQFSDRQRDVAARHGSGVIYTPQLTVDGRDFRQRYDLGSLRRKLTAINREKGQAKIRADIYSSATEVRISGEVEILGGYSGKRVQIWIAVFENGLSSRVTAGENAGSRLNHDYVVRELAGPFSIGAGSRTALEHRIKLQSDWNAERVGIAIFVERSDTGEILEATAKYPLCSS